MMASLRSALAASGGRIGAIAFAIALLSSTGCDDPTPPSEEPPTDAVADPETDADATDDEVDELPATPPDFAETVAAVRPAVVNIYTRTDPPGGEPAPSPYAPPGMVPDDRVEESLGSGFIFDDRGLVLTNDHVVDGAAEIAVRLLDERVYSAEILGGDPPTDIAVLELQDVDDELPVAEFGDSDELQVGNWVLAIGNPLGLASTVTAGITSAEGRQLTEPAGQLRFQDFIQTDASINPGSSGGPLVDVFGDVVGVATAVSSEGQGLGFAIPINMADEVLSDLIEFGRVRRSWLGIYIGSVPSRLYEELDIPEQTGVMITRLIDDGPADAAGIEPGDIVVDIDGETIEDPAHLAWLAATLGIDETVDARLFRGEEEKTISIELEEMPQD